MNNNDLTNVSLLRNVLNSIVFEGRQVCSHYVRGGWLLYPITRNLHINRSVGVMAYVLLTGFTPFGGDTDQETFHNICHGQLDFPDELFEDVSAQAEDFIRKTLTRDPR